MVVMSSSDSFFKIVVLPELSRPRTRIRAYMCGFISAGTFSSQDVHADPLPLLPTSAAFAIARAVPKQ